MVHLALGPGLGKPVKEASASSPKVKICEDAQMTLCLISFTNVLKIVPKGVFFVF